MCGYVLSVIDHLTRFVLRIPVPNKATEIVAAALNEYVVGIFGPSETLHSDQGR